MFAGRKERGAWPEGDATPTRGKYEAISQLSPSRRLLGVFFILALWVAGLGFMLVHHFYLSFLNEKSIDSVTGELPPVLRHQGNVNFIGTAIAHGARAALSTAIGITFAQLFWETLRSRSWAIREIDALVRCGQSPFHYSVYRAATASFLVFLVSCTASAMALIVIIAPGSLTVSSEFQRTRSCTVPTVPNVMEARYQQNDQLAASIAGILTSNTYLSPFRATTCDAGSSSCSYNISFVGPAFNCIDVSNQTNFTDLLNPSAIDPTVPFLIWDETDFAENVRNPNGFPIGASVLTQDLVKGVTQANNCTTYNATYDVGVIFQGDSTIAQVSNVELHNVVVNDNITDTFISAYAQNVVDSLGGPIYAGSSGYAQGATTQVQNAAFFVTTPSGNHTWSDNITDVLTSYMQNVSLSLLSGNINTGFSNDTSTNLLYVNSTCASTFTVYIYDSSRLLITYGIALGVALLAVIPGCWLIVKNGTEEKLILSHILEFALNEHLLPLSGKVQDHTRLRLKKGKLYPSSHPLDDEPYTTEKPSSESFVSKWKRRLERITAGEGQMFSLILAGLCLMLLHHQYYRYLDGKTPSQSLRHASSSTLFGNQRFVSSAGLALAYIAQMLFVTAIAIASSQIFWRNLRSRGHSISQIDALMKTRLNPFTFSAFPAAKALIAIPLLALLGVAMSLLSIFAPGAISVSFQYTRSGECTVQSLGNLTSLLTDSDASDYTTPIGTVLSTGTFIPPLSPCDGSDGMQCSYDLQFIGPGYACEDVTASSDFAAFASWSPDPDGFNMTNVYNASIVPEASDLTIQMSVQTWDMKRSLYQSVNCSAVSRSYSVTVTHNSTSRIDVLDSQILSPILSQPGVDLTQTPGDGNISFAQDYAVSGMTLLIGAIGTEVQGVGLTMDLEGNQPPFMGSLPLYIGGLGSFLVDGNFTWRENMTIALEEYAQNLTLSLLSDQIFPFNNPGETSLLRNGTTECTYTFTAWKYTPWRLFVTYGIAALATLICVIGGISAIRANGVDESMDFSRFLRAVLNERLYQSSELDLDVRLKADRSIEGTLAPDDS